MMNWRTRELVNHEVVVPLIEAATKQVGFTAKGTITLKLVVYSAQEMDLLYKSARDRSMLAVS
jgi:hypothetical protein